jgi:hypothetical protein
MSSDQPVASAAFVAVLPDGSRRPIRAGVGRPHPTDTGEWRCPVWLDGLHPGLPEIAGEDALQALGLAWQLLAQLLRDFVRSGGRLEFPGGGTVPLDAYFGGEARDGGPAA